MALRVPMDFHIISSSSSTSSRGRNNSVQSKMTLAWSVQVSVLLAFAVAVSLLLRAQLCECKTDEVYDVIIIGAGIAGITAGKTLSERGVKNFVILEATERIGGRMKSERFAGVVIEDGANWVEGVNGPEVNPIWKLAQEINLRTFYSDYGNLSSNIYGNSGYIPAAQTEEAFNASKNSFDFAETLGASLTQRKAEDVSILYAQRAFGRVPSTPLEMALDYNSYDYEYAEPPRTTSLQNTQPLPTFTNYGYDIYFVADKRGYVSIVHHLADSYLDKEDRRLHLNKVVNKIEYSADGVTVWTENGDKYAAKYAIVTVSLGVLQSGLIDFDPHWPDWKLEVLRQYDMAIYTKIFLKFPYKFWPDQEFFLYADKRRGYYPIWQTLDNEYPGSNILIALATDDESRRIEQQPDNETLAELTDVLKTMFGESTPEAQDIFVSRWWTNRFFRGSYSNWPIGFSKKEFTLLQAPLGRVHFGGEHYDESYNGYVHGAYFSGMQVGKGVAKCLRTGSCDSKGR